MEIFLVPADIFYEEVLYDDFTAADPKHGQELDWLHSHRVQQGLQAPTLGKSAAGVQTFALNHHNQRLCKFSWLA